MDKEQQAARASAATQAVPQEDTMGVIGSDGTKHHLFRTRAEEDAAVARSPLKVATDLIELAAKVEREPMKHTLKTDSEVFQAVADGRKKFEIRKADRDFRVGDLLDLLETASTGEEMAAGAPLEYTGGEIIVQVTHVLRGPLYGLAAGWCLMSIEPADAVPPTLKEPKAK